MHLSDFSDRLPPMLVKELRQGLRTRTFVAIFLSLQVILGLILLFAGAAAASDSAGKTISNIIFTFFSIAVLVIQPMRGMTAVSSEIKEKTVDLMVLTRLSAWRIVTGKWSAIVGQSALLLITIVPYLILRYFFGGMNLVGEIILLALIFLTSVTLTAITVGLSASGSTLIRSIIPMIGLPIGGYIFLMALIFGRGQSGLVELCSLEDYQSQIIVGLYAAFCLYYGFFSLSMGTSLIAPLAENHSTLRRLVALVLTVIAAGICSMSFVEKEFIPLVFSLLFLPAFMISLSEFGMMVPPIYSKFEKYGISGRLAATVLGPGWASGFFFCALLSLLSAIPFFINSPFDKTLLAVWAAILASLLFPAICLSLMKASGEKRIAAYLLILIASVIGGGAVMMISKALSNDELVWLFFWVPPVTAYQIADRSANAETMAVLVALGYFLILGAMAFRSYRDQLMGFGLSRNPSSDKELPQPNLD